MYGKSAASSFPWEGEPLGTRYLAFSGSYLSYNDEIWYTSKMQYPKTTNLLIVIKLLRAMKCGKIQYLCKCSQKGDRE